MPKIFIDKENGSETFGPTGGAHKRNPFTDFNRQAALHTQR